MMVRAHDTPSSWGCPGTTQGKVTGAGQMLMQGFHICNDLHTWDSTSTGLVT